MPKGVVHYAKTDPAESFHLTIGLHRENMQWLDLLHYLLSSQPSDGEAPARVPATGDVQLSTELIQIYSETARGVHLHEAVPGWLLLCRRVWNRQSAGKAEAEAATSGASCAAFDAELRRVYDAHMGRFAAWVCRQSQRGLWKLALQLAEAEKSMGEPADLEGLDHLFWWPGNTESFLPRLRPDHARFAAALDWIANVVVHRDTLSPRWVRRKRGGSQKRRPTRRRGEPPPDGAPTLCDELTGWESECRGSNADHCEAYVAERTTCEQWCEAQGAWCEAAWDEQPSGHCTRNTRGSSACTTNRTSQICRCRRECADEGPWPCHEEGCPARSVTCAILSVACRAKFSDIWRKPPLGLAQSTVAQACPASCQQCMCKNPDADAMAAVGRAARLPAFVSAKPSTDFVE